MVITPRGPSRTLTILSPGQRFESIDPIPADRHPELVVARLVRDRFGLLHVTLRTSEGREISAFADQVEAAIADGHLRPVSGRIAVSC